MEQTQKKLLQEFIKENLGMTVRIFLINGFQLKGRLIDADEHYLKLSTGDYGGQKEILISITGISTFVPC